MVKKVPVVPSMSLLTQKHFENVKEQLISYIMKYLQTSLGIGGASQKDPFHQIEISTSVRTHSTGFQDIVSTLL